MVIAEVSLSVCRTELEEAFGPGRQQHPVMAEFSWPHFSMHSTLAPNDKDVRQSAQQHVICQCVLAARSLSLRSHVKVTVLVGSNRSCEHMHVIDNAQHDGGAQKRSASNQSFQSMEIFEHCISVAANSPMDDNRNTRGPKAIVGAHTTYMAMTPETTRR